MIWLADISLAEINARLKNTLGEHLGMEFIAIGDDYLKARMPVDKRTQQPLGILNGGASCALAETLASTAANYCVDQKLSYCVGLDINANHLRSAYSNTYVTAITKPIHLGKSTQIWAIEIFDENEKKICIARMTAIVMHK